MAKAIWNGQTLAESETYETVEGNIYFPDESVRREFFRASSTTSSCTWKGQARYYTIVVDGQENPDAAWYYPDPKPAARKVKHHVAFWRGVEDHHLGVSGRLSHSSPLHFCNQFIPMLHVEQFAPRGAIAFGRG